jgi:hypothetical protein
MKSFFFFVISVNKCSNKYQKAKLFCTINTMYMVSNFTHEMRIMLSSIGHLLLKKGNKIFNTKISPNENILCSWISIWSACNSSQNNSTQFYNSYLIVTQPTKMFMIKLQGAIYGGKDVFLFSDFSAWVLFVRSVSLPVSFTQRSSQNLQNFMSETIKFSMLSLYY